MINQGGNSLKLLPTCKALWRKQCIFKDEWFVNHLENIVKKTGPRYSPELNVQLPISEIFDGLSRNSDFYGSIRKKFGKLRKSFLRLQIQYQSTMTGYSP